MRRFVSLLAIRSLRRSVALVLILAALASVALIFAWMSPSIAAARVAVWQALPQDVRISFVRTSPADSCTAVLVFTTVDSGRGLAHPLGLWGGDLIDALGLAPHAAGTVAVADALAAAEGGLSNGDLVTIALKGQVVRGEIEVRELPIQLTDASSGVLALSTANEVVRAISSYGEPEEQVCLSRSDAAARAGDLLRTRRQEVEASGLGSAAALFAGLAAAAWLSLTLLVLGSTALRRRDAADLLSVYGQRGLMAALATLADVAVGAGLALPLAIALALALRSWTLRMWTDPAAVAASGVVFAALLAGAILLVVAMLARRQR